MNKSEQFKNRVLIVGEGEQTFSVVSNVLNAGQEAVLLTADQLGAREFIGKTSTPLDVRHRLTLLDSWAGLIPCTLAIAITREQADPKRKVIRQLIESLPDDTLICVNTESISLEELQKDVSSPERVIGLNWCYPAHLTFFLEIITNARTDQALVAKLETLAREFWGKDPYVLRNGFSTRARMMAAWAREAIYLVENGYASMESIDRACRNDPGYYLPFAGNFRYMDLMGTYAYGMVMKDLNPDLAQETHVPANLARELAAYSSSETVVDEDEFLRFSEEIRELILKYPHEAVDI